LEVERGDRADVIVTSDIDTALPERGADVCILATDSFTKDVYPKLVTVLSRGVNAISTAEEMSYPAAKEPELAKEIDRVAKEFGVTALGTGINPGLMMDLLAICLTGCMTNVDKGHCAESIRSRPLARLLCRSRA
jgi:4-hydroxy-tetrahydrodipicolinate reductase